MHIAERKLTNIYLGGKLGQLFGEKWQLAVTSPAEAIKAIDINLKGKLRQYLFNEGRNKYYKISLQDKKNVLDKVEWRNRSGNSDIYILPTIKGRNSPLAKIGIGVALVLVAIFAPEIGLPALVGTNATGAAAVIGDIVVGIGTSLVLGGISQLLAPHPQTQGSLESNIFQGTVTAGVQGGCVPVIYGTALSKPIPVSIWFENVDYNTTTNQYVGTVQVAQVPGGGYEFTPGAAAVNTNYGG